MPDGNASLKYTRNFLQHKLPGYGCQSCQTLSQQKQIQLDGRPLPVNQRNKRIKQLEGGGRVGGLQNSLIKPQLVYSAK